MKIRSGFVSNSSSSSFVLIGCEVNKKELQKIQEKLVGREKVDSNDYAWEDDAYEAIEDAGWLYDGERDKPIIGKILTEQADDGDYLEDASFSIKKIQDLADEVKEKIGKEPKLFMGTRAC
jgi:hypothetical protein